jgi:tRNA1(Val) A37 N6-methylase TrmN6
MTTVNHLLGGSIILHQPKEGFRASIDGVFLGSLLEATSSQRVLDIGCGVGTIVLCAGHRVPNLSLFGIELDPSIADLARLNSAENHLPLTIYTGDMIRNFEKILDEMGGPMDHVLTNPPYLTGGTPSKNDYRRQAFFHKESINFEKWALGCHRYLKPQGYLWGIQRSDLLHEVLHGLSKYFVDIEIFPLVPKAGQPAHRILFKAKKPRVQKTNYRLSPMILQTQRIVHEQDGSYSFWADGILKMGKSFIS